MRPVWFRLTLAAMAISSAAFAIVDQSLSALDAPPQPPRAMAAVVGSAPAAPAALRPSPQPYTQADRSLFTVVEDAEPDPPGEDVDFAVGEPVLRGVVIAGLRRKALIAADPNAPGEWVGAGGRVAGAVVAAIEPRRVFLRRGGAGFWISLAALGG